MKWQTENAKRYVPNVFDLSSFSTFTVAWFGTRSTSVTPGKFKSFGQSPPLLTISVAKFRPPKANCDTWQEVNFCGAIFKNLMCSFKVVKDFHNQLLISTSPFWISKRPILKRPIFAQQNLVNICTVWKVGTVGTNARTPELGGVEGAIKERGERSQKKS